MLSLPHPPAALHINPFPPFRLPLPPGSVSRSPPSTKNGLRVPSFHRKPLPPVACRSVTSLQDDEEGPGERGGGIARAQGALLGTAMLWGTFPATLKLLYEQDGAPSDPVLICAIRFVLMALITFSTLPVREILGKLISGRGGLASFELGSLGVLGTALQTSSLGESSAVRVAILLSLINVFTPLLAALTGKSPVESNITPQTWAACLLALFSTVFAVIGNGGESIMGGSMLGDAEAIGSAFFYSSAKVRIGSLLKENDADILVGGRFLIQAALALTALAIQHQPLSSQWPAALDWYQWTLL
ncbi:hypothetical protein AAMO2058_001713000, partial [Amorphochlora amoebiformis]